MMRRAKRYLMVFLAVWLISIAVGGGAVQAQDEEEPTSLTGVRLWVYPEYDEPSLLVMIEGEVVGVEIPTTVRVLVPTTGEVIASSRARSTRRRT